jgi:predicted NBD/HSP70 family sugar kinase
VVIVTDLVLSKKQIILSGIRRVLLQQGSVTKVELSEKLGISFPTIGKFLTKMEREGEVFSAGLDDSSGGRRAKRYTYNPEYKLGLAIFLERDETNYLVFNGLGEVKETGEVSSSLMEDGLLILKDCVARLTKTYPKISSISIGVPASVDNGKIFYIPGYEHLHHFDLKSYLEKQFSIPVIIENDMNAAVLGYYEHHRSLKNKSLIYFYSGQNGPGAGIMVNGSVVRGSTHFSGEVSFVPLYDERNFRQAMEKGNSTYQVRIGEKHEVDAISRLIASFTAILNPDAIIFSNQEVNATILEQLQKQSSLYIPGEHLPNLITSDWQQDYLLGLQSLGLSLMINEITI